MDYYSHSVHHCLDLGSTFDCFGGWRCRARRRYHAVWDWPRSEVGVDYLTTALTYTNATWVSLY